MMDRIFYESKMIYIFDELIIDLLKNIIGIIKVILKYRDIVFFIDIDLVL